MSKSKLKFEYDQSVDAAYLTLGRGRVSGSEEVQPGVVVDFDADGRVVGVEILRFAKRFVNKVKLKSMSAHRGRSLKKSA